MTDAQFLVLPPRPIGIIRGEGQCEVPRALDFVEVDLQDLVMSDGEFVEAECTVGGFVGR